MSAPKDSISEFMRAMRSGTLATDQSTLSSESLFRPLKKGRVASSMPADVQATLEDMARQGAPLVVPQPAPAGARPPQPATPAADRIVAWLGENGPASPRVVLNALGLGFDEGLAAFDRLERFGILRRTEGADGPTFALVGP